VEDAAVTPAPSLVVLAAGVGSRYGGLKQIDRVGPSGETLLDYAAFDARRAGFSRVVFVIRRTFEADFAEATAAMRKHVEVAHVFQELDRLPPGFEPPDGRTKPWGTGHAVLAADDAVATPFAVVNADDFYGAASYRAVAGFLAPARVDGTHYAMVGFRLADTLSEHGGVARGVCRTREGDLAAIEEVTGLAPTAEGVQGVGPAGAVRLTGDEPVSMNLWGFTPTLFAHLRERFAAFLAEQGHDPGSEFLLPTVVSALIREGRARVRVLPGGGPWFGVTFRADRERLAERIQALVRSGEYPSPLWAA
jgi:hypothetical protein